MEHSDRPACFGLEHLHAAPAVLGRRIVVVEDGETVDDLVGDMIEVLTNMCARMYGPRGARNRALRAVPAAKQHSALVAASAPKGQIDDVAVITSATCIPPLMALDFLPASQRQARLSARSLGTQRIPNSTTAGPASTHVVAARRANPQIPTSKWPM